MMNMVSVTPVTQYTPVTLMPTLVPTVPVVPVVPLVPVVQTPVVSAPAIQSQTISNNWWPMALANQQLQPTNHSLSMGASLTLNTLTPRTLVMNMLMWIA